VSIVNGVMLHNIGDLMYGVLCDLSGTKLLKIMVGTVSIIWEEAMCVHEEGHLIHNYE